jgi:hypothetical protein
MSGQAITCVLINPEMSIRMHRRVSKEMVRQMYTD